MSRTRAIVRRPTTVGLRPGSMVNTRNLVRAGVGAARFGLSAYRQYRQQNQSSQRRSGGNIESAPLYGSTFTSKVGYKSRRPNRRRLRRAKRSFRTFLKNSMVLQNPQNGQSSGQFNVVTTPAGSPPIYQQWASLDVLSAAAVYQMIRGQLPGGTTRTGLRDFELNLKTFNMRYYLVNTGSSPLMVDIYYVHPRRSILGKEVNATLSAPTNGNVLAAWFKTNYSNAVPANSDLQPDPGADPLPDWSQTATTPFMYENFCRSFKIDRIRNLVLPPGGTFEARESIRMRRLNLARLGELLSTPEFNLLNPTGNNDTGNFYLKGMSRSILIGFRGFPDNTLLAQPGQLAFRWEETSTSKVMQTRPGSNAVYAGNG